MGVSALLSINWEYCIPHRVAVRIKWVNDVECLREQYSVYIKSSVNENCGQKCHVRAKQ